MERAGHALLKQHKDNAEWNVIHSEQIHFKQGTFL